MPSKKSMRLCFSTSISSSSAFHHHHRKSNFHRTQKTSYLIVASSESSSKMEGKKSLLATPLACMIPTCVYLDYNATTPIFPEVCDEMLPFLHTHFGNPSSIHAYAMPCSLAIDVSRERVRKALGATNGKKEIVFTSCGTESDNRAIDIACDLFNSSASSDEATCVLPHVISTAVEHPAVLVYLESERKAKRLTYSLVPVNEEGVGRTSRRSRNSWRSFATECVA